MVTTKITKTFGPICYGHMLPNHDGLCRNPHGHNGVLKVTIEGDIFDDPKDSEDGMVMDFGRLKAIVKPLVEQLDHHFVVKGDEWVYIMVRDVANHMYTLTDQLQEALKAQDAHLQQFFITGFRTTAENIATWFANSIAFDLRHEKGVCSVEVEFWETPDNSARAYLEVHYVEPTTH